MLPVLNIQAEFNDAQDGKITPQELAQTIANRLTDLPLTDPEQDALRVQMRDSFWECAQDRTMRVSWFVDFIQDLYDNGEAWEVVPSFEYASEYSANAKMNKR